MIHWLPRCDAQSIKFVWTVGPFKTGRESERNPRPKSAKEK